MHFGLSNADGRYKMDFFWAESQRRVGPEPGGSERSLVSFSIWRELRSSMLMVEQSAILRSGGSWIWGLLSIGYAAAYYL